MGDWIVYLLVRGISWGLNCLPYLLRVELVARMIQLYVFIIPRYKRIIRTNFNIAFPEKSEEWKNEVIRDNYRSLARAYVDFIAIPHLPDDWARTCVEVPHEQERFWEPKRRAGGKGVIFVTGHLGSFELLPFFNAQIGSPGAFIARKFKQSRLDTWWNQIRSTAGGRTIPRDGALRKMIRELRAGVDVGFLFDQNVVRNNAVFVDWFGVPAATTIALGYAALKTEVPVVVIVMQSVGDGRYIVHLRDCDFSDIYANATMTWDEKINHITQVVTDKYIELIRLNPAGWFWMHRRWRTRPNEGDPQIYG